MVICILGILAAIYPGMCRGFIKSQYKQNRNVKKSKSNNSPIRFEGHHPDCRQFENHTFKFDGKKYCPGCSGLFIGALIAVLGSLFYYFEGLPTSYAQNFFWIGTGLVFAVLFLIVFINLEKRLKFISNLILVVGSFLILIGILKAKDNLLMELYFLVLIVFWIITRICISETYHENICVNCQKESGCIYD